MKKRIAIILIAITLLFVGCGKIEETKLVYNRFSVDEEWEIDTLENASRNLCMIYNQDKTAANKIASYPVLIDVPNFLISEVQASQKNKHLYNGKDHVFTVLLSTSLENLSEINDYKISSEDIDLKINGNKIKPIKSTLGEIEVEKSSNKDVVIQYYTEKDISEIETVEVTFKKLKQKLSIIVNK